jgi:glycosyltransferase involved in cell wall biosynthesis
MNAAAPRPRTLVLSNLAWDYLWQRHQSIASLLAQDYDVVYCELPGMRRIGLRDAGRIARRFLRFLRPAAAPGTGPSPPVGLTIARPFIVPSTNPLFHALNRVFLHFFLRRQPALTAGVDLIVTYTASRAALHLIARVSHRTLVYECTDNFRAIAGLPACFAGDEARLLRDADLTVVPGPTLGRIHRGATRRLEVLPHGAMIDRFVVPPVSASTPTRLIYYGHIYRQHLDCALIQALARARPDWQITLVGPILSPERFPPNVDLPGPQPHERLRDFLRDARVIILPYAINDYTRTVLPAKIYECLATGRPIVATPLPDLQAALPNLISYANDLAAFLAAIERALHADPPAAREARIAAAQAATWQHRYSCFREFLAAATQS